MTTIRKYLTEQRTQTLMLPLLIALVITAALLSFTNIWMDTSLFQITLTIGSWLVFFTVLAYLAYTQSTVEENIEAPLPQEDSVTYELLNYIPGNTIIVSESGEIVFANSSAQNTFRYMENSLQEKNINICDLLPGSNKDAVLEYIEDCLDQNNPIDSLEIFALRSDASYFPASVAMRPINLEGKRHIALTIADISLQKLEEERIHLQQYSVEQATDALFWIDKSGQVIYANELACRMLDYSTVDLSLMSFDDFTQKNEGDTDWNSMWELAKECGSCVFETRIKNKKGQVFPVEVVLSFIPLESEGSYMCAYVRNIQHRKVEEQRLLQYTKELERKNEELEQFTFITSHHLQEPLRSISSFAQILEKRYKNSLDAEGEEYLTFMVDSVKRMHDLLRDLSKYANLSTKARTIEMVEMDAVIEMGIKRLQKNITTNDAQIHYHNLPLIKGNKEELAQLFQNLISNGLKYRSEENPAIHITAEEYNGNFYKFAVSDNGIGIPKEYSDKIFKLFNRLHNTKAYTGTGIGLAICQKIVEKHGGQIWVEAAANKGTVFYFTLPTHIQIYRQTA